MNLVFLISKALNQYDIFGHRIPTKQALKTSKASIFSVWEYSLSSLRSTTVWSLKLILATIKGIILSLFLIRTSTFTFIRSFARLTCFLAAATWRTVLPSSSWWLRFGFCESKKLHILLLKIEYISGLTPFKQGVFISPLGIILISHFWYPCLKRHEKEVYKDRRCSHWYPRFERSSSSYNLLSWD